MDRLNAMRIFARVIDTGGFAAAARDLQLSPAAVTRQIAELEEHLGARLINRTTRRLALTGAGANYLDRVRQILTDVDEAEAQANLATSDPRGHVRVLVPPAFAVHQIAKNLPRFHADYPHVTVELVTSGPVETVDESVDITIIIIGNRLLEGEFIARRLAQTEVIVCATPEYLDRHGRPQHPNDLQDHAAMVPAFLRELRFQQGHFGDDEPGGDSVRLQLRRPVLSTNHVDTMYAAALAGLGIAGLPSFVVEDALLENALERVLPEWHMQASTIYAAMPTRKHVPARTRAFLDFLIAQFGSVGGDRDPWLLAAGCETKR
ncbi:LysR family transcriptional regulator [Piscinibacter sakaiensis]|uniref:LysR family transcriptional regulator n=1 Tax=Piscinibacter sakaiensis TaxID=1547922 RepID=UPI003AABC354